MIRQAAGMFFFLLGAVSTAVGAVGVAMGAFAAAWCIVTGLVVGCLGIRLGLALPNDSARRKDSLAFGLALLLLGVAAFASKAWLGWSPVFASPDRVNIIALLAEHVGFELAAMGACVLVAVILSLVPQKVIHQRYVAVTILTAAIGLGLLILAMAR